MFPRHPSKVAIKEPTIRRSDSATRTVAMLSIAPRMSAIVSVMLGDVPAARHNVRSASASSNRHSRIKKVSILSDEFIYLKREGRMPASRLAPAEGEVRNLASEGYLRYTYKRRRFIRRANSSCSAGFCRLLRFPIPLPVYEARQVRVDSLHFPRPTPVRRHRPERPSRFGAFCL